MNTIQGIILGLIQGISEFLPISSSGHLVIAQTLFGLSNNNMAFDIFLHLATFFAVVIAYFNTVKNLIIEFFRMLWDILRFKGLCLDKSKYRYYIIYIIIATIPAGVAGVLFDDYIEAVFSSVLFVASALLLTGAILVIGEKAGANNTMHIEELGVKKSFITGIFQMFAIVPGLSRSGTTLTGGLISGLNREEALEFSFLLSLPTTLGSVILKLSDISTAIHEISLIPAIAGFVAAFISGILSIFIFRKIAKKGSFAGFAIYCWAIGLTLLINIGRI